MRKPKPIAISRHAPPSSGRIAWSAEPKASALTGNVKLEEKERARLALEAAIRSDGFDPGDCAFTWTMIEAGWGWVVKLKEGARA
jgi:hypothetical protein